MTKTVSYSIVFTILRRCYSAEGLKKSRLEWARDLRNLITESSGKPNPSKKKIKGDSTGILKIWKEQKASMLQYTLYLCQIQFVM